MKYSMKRQFAFIFITLITGTILMCLILNSTLLGTYYLNKKQNALVSAYYSINEASSAGDIISEEYDIELKKFVRNTIFRYWWRTGNRKRSNIP